MLMHRPATLVQLGLSIDEQLPANGVDHDGTQFACFVHGRLQIGQRRFVKLQRTPLQQGRIQSQGWVLQSPLRAIQTLKTQLFSQLT